MLLLEERKGREKVRKRSTSRSRSRSRSKRKEKKKKRSSSIGGRAHHLPSPFSLSALLSLAIPHFSSRQRERVRVLQLHPVEFIKDSQVSSKSTPRRPRFFQSPFFFLILLLQSHLLRRGLVQRHGAASAAASGHHTQLRAPRSPGQGGHEVPGHEDGCLGGERKKRVELSLLSILNSRRTKKKKKKLGRRSTSQKLDSPFSPPRSSAERRACSRLIRSLSTHTPYSQTWPRLSGPAPPPVPAPLDAALHRGGSTRSPSSRPATVRPFSQGHQRPAGGNEDYGFLEVEEGASYFDFRLHEAVAEASRTGERHWDEEVEAVGLEEVGGGQGQGGGQNQGGQNQAPPPPTPPTIDAFDLPAGLIPELVNAARTAGCRPHAPIRAEDAEAAARVARAEEEREQEQEGKKDNNTIAPITPYLSARLAALEAELEAYVPGMTRADLEEKLARARGEATRGSGWEAVMRRRAAEAAVAAAGIGGGGGGGAETGGSRRRRAVRRAAVARQGRGRV